MRSLNGPEVTIIDPLAGTTSTDRHSLSLTTAAAGAVVSGFTLQGTYDTSSSTANSALNLSAGVVTNCIIRNNLAGGSGGGIYQSGGLVVDCRFFDNYAIEHNHGKGGGLYCGDGAVAGTVDRFEKRLAP